MTSLLLTLSFLQLISIIDSPTQHTVDRYLENAVYHELTMKWIVPKNDPYTLENFQNAYNNLSSGNTLQDLTPSQLAEFKKKRKLKPTHYLLKFYPKTLDQIYKLQKMKDVTISSFPDNYVSLQADEVRKVEELFVLEKPLFPEKSPYTIRYDEYESPEFKTDTTTYVMPIMYIGWPVGKKKPRRIKCKKYYDAFIPDYQKHTRCLSLSREALEILELEATAIATKNDEMNIFLYHD